MTFNSLDMDKEGRVFRIFVPDSEIVMTEEFLGDSNLSIHDFYQIAFEDGKKVAAARLRGSGIFMEDPVSGYWVDPEAVDFEELIVPITEASSPELFDPDGSNNTEFRLLQFDNSKNKK